jgi:hypothetical protein
MVHLLLMNERLNGLPHVAVKENFMNQEPEDLLPGSQIQPKAFHYKVIVEGSLEPVFVTVIAINSTSAKMGLQQHPAFAGKTINYYGCSEHIIQVN